MLLKGFGVMNHSSNYWTWTHTHTHTNFGPMGHIHFLDKSNCCDGQGIFEWNKFDHGNISLPETKYQSTICMQIPIFTQAITPRWTALILSIAQLKWPPLKVTFQINCFTLDWLKLIKEGVMRLGFCVLEVSTQTVLLWVDDTSRWSTIIRSFCAFLWNSYPN